jgi:hypothetical protein
MFLGMKLVKKVRDFAKLNAWEMHKLMKKKTVQAYLSLERKAKRITLEDLNRLEDIYLSHGGKLEDFRKLLRELEK